MKIASLHKYAGPLACGRKTSSPRRALAKLAVVAAALFASVHLASAQEVDVLLTSTGDTASNPNGNYWNVLEFLTSSDGSCESASPASDIYGFATGISVSGCAQGWEQYCADDAGGTITFEIDLPAGTYDIIPGFGPGSSSATITGGSFSGIIGPTTVYLTFLNNGYAITTASSIVITQETEVDVLLTSTGDTASNPNDNYWNVLEFLTSSDGSCESASPALDINENTTGISVSGCAQGWEQYCADDAGGTITFEIDLPCGTFDVVPGFGPGSSSATITDDQFTGITGPTTVYLTFLNNGYAITTASSIIVYQY